MPGHASFWETHQISLSKITGSLAYKKSIKSNKSIREGKGGKLDKLIQNIS